MRGLKLPIPIRKEEVLYDKVTIKTPTPGIIADTKKIADNGDYFGAISAFLSGVITAVHKGDKEITDKVSIKSILPLMPYRSAEPVSVQAMLLIDDNDAIEGVYNCPRCNEQMVYEAKYENDQIVYDNRDFVSDLDITYSDTNEDIKITFSEPVEIMMNNEVVETINTIELENPTLQHCQNAYMKKGNKDELRLQFQVYIEALKKVNGVEIDNKWKNRNGMYMFDNIPNLKKDFLSIGREIEKFGMEKKLKKTCTRCGKEFDAYINTSNFFDLGVQPM